MGAAPLAMAPAAAEILGTTAAAAAPVAASAAAPGIMGSLYGLLPGIGGEQAAMLAAQTGEFGLPGLLATGNAAGSVAGSPFAALKTLGSGASNVNSAMRLLSPQQQARPAMAAPRPMAAMPMQSVPSPIELMQWRRHQMRQRRM